MAAPTALSRWFDSRWARFDGPSRLAGVDLARGLAVLGMLAAHLLTIEPWEIGRPETWLDVVNGRSSILFATLAGVSIALVTGGTEPLRDAARGRASGRIAVRAGVLWMLGVLLIFTGVPVYVILPAYAILFLLALPFLGLRAPTLFAIAGALALTMPFLQAWLDELPLWSTAEGDVLAAGIGWAYPFPTWLAFVVAGLALGRSDLRSATVQIGLLGAGVSLATLAYGLDALTGSGVVEERTSYLGAVWTARAHSSGLLEVIGSGAFAVAVLALALLACRTFLRWPAVPVRAVGAMPLTAYTAQLLVWAVLAAVVVGDAEDLFGVRALEPFWPMTLWIVFACTAWALLVGRGPLEILLDRAARWVVREPSDSVDALDKLER